MRALASTAARTSRLLPLNMPAPATGTLMVLGPFFGAASRFHLNYVSIHALVDTLILVGLVFFPLLALFCSWSLWLWSWVLTVVQALGIGV